MILPNLCHLNCDSNRYCPPLISKTATPFCEGCCRTPGASVVGLPPSKTESTSVVGTYTVARVLGGTVTSIRRRPDSTRHRQAIGPRMLS